MLKINKKGFTMVELLIVLAIIAILAAVAIPVYSSQLENARKEVDNSNLRAATGLASQDYILRYSGITNATDERNYIVFTYENTGNAAGAVKSQNMIVYPASGSVTKDGTWHDNKGPNGRVSSTAPGALVIPPDGGETLDVTGGGILDSGKVVPLPLQQNSGNARFHIVIANGGIVKYSRIVTGHKVTVKP